MGDSSAIIYGLETRARSFSSQCSGDTEAIRFLVGTQSFRGEEERGTENQIHLVEYDDERHTTNKTILKHDAGEIWQVHASPVNPMQLTTCYNKISNDSVADMRACLWKLPFDPDDEPLADDGHPHSLVKLSDIGGKDEGDMKCVTFNPNEGSDELVTLGDTALYLWDIGTTSARLKSNCSLDGKGHPKFTCCHWDPHHRGSQVCTANDCCIRGWDLRSMQQTYSIENAHGQLVRDFDFNPNRQYIIASCGDDCRTKFWDVRNPEEPLKILDDHSHWVWSVRFNHFHDQLILTASSDSRVILNNVSTLSSEPYGKLIEDPEDEEEDNNKSDRMKEPLKDTVVQVFEEHEDSVYAVEWSSTDPWVFASLSYDGRLVINHVPRTEKYRILL